MPDNKNSAFSFEHLDWDTEFFGYKTGKAILNNPLSDSEWNSLHKQLHDYELSVIKNLNSEIGNAQLIARYTKAFLAEESIILTKKLTGTATVPDNVEIHSNYPRDERMIEIADFTGSRFVEDPMLKERGGADVYRQWLINSFEKEDKIFGLCKNGEDLSGYILFSFTGQSCFVELMNVAPTSLRSGIGTKLFTAMEAIASRRGCMEISICTQLKNYKAINLYHKIGYRMTACHQVYHLWNIS